MAVWRGRGRGGGGGRGSGGGGGDKVLDWQCLMTKEGEKKAEIKVFGVEKCGRVQEWEVTKVD